MPRNMKRILSVAGPILVLLVSTLIFSRYAQGAGSEMLIAWGFGVLLAITFVVSLSVVRRSRRAAQVAGREVAERDKGARFLLADFNRKAIRTLENSGVPWAMSMTKGLSIVKIESDHIDVFRTSDRRLLGSLVVGLQIVGFAAITINRGNAYDEPCIRLSFTNGATADVIIYDISTGKWPQPEALQSLPRSA